MRLLVDFHHHALAESLLQLFEDRHAVEVWFPYGMGWFESDVWQFEKTFHGDAVARQYLEGIWSEARPTGNGTVRRDDPRHPGRTHRGIELEAARALRWDLVISTLPANDIGFRAFAAETGARFGIQLGNNHQDSWVETASFVLASTTLPGLERQTANPDSWGKVIQWRGVPTIVYHQSFDLDIFRPGRLDEAEDRTIASFMNCFPETPIYPRFRERADHQLREYDVKVFGAYGSAPLDRLAAGDISRIDHVADAMRSARVIWHEKWWGDGYGHVIHNAFAVGRPVVGSFSYYRDKLASELWLDGITGFDLDRLDEEGRLSLTIRQLVEDDGAWLEICRNGANRFRELVDFDREADAIGDLLDL